MPVGVVAEDDAGHVVEGEGPHGDFDGVTLPLGVAGQEDRVHQPGLVVDRVLLQVGIALLLADGPGVEVADRVGPRPERHAAVRQVMVFLDRAVELADRPGQPAGRERRRSRRGRARRRRRASTTRPGRRATARREGVRERIAAERPSGTPFWNPNFGRDLGNDSRVECRLADEHGYGTRGKRAPTAVIRNGFRIFG